MTDSIRAARRRGGLNMDELARRLGTRQSAVSQLEKSERDGTIKLESLRRALAALGQDLLITTSAASDISPYSPARVAHELASEIASNNKPMAMRILTDAARRLRDHGAHLDPASIETPPIPLPDQAWDSFAKYLYREALGDRAAEWMRPQKLDRPTYLLDEPVFRSRADRDTSDDLRELNLLVDSRSFARA